MHIRRGVIGLRCIHYIVPLTANGTRVFVKTNATHRRRTREKPTTRRRTPSSTAQTTSTSTRVLQLLLSLCHRHGQPNTRWPRRDCKQIRVHVYFARCPTYAFVVCAYAEFAAEHIHLMRPLLPACARGSHRLPYLLSISFSSLSLGTQLRILSLFLSVGRGLVFGRLSLKAPKESISFCSAHCLKQHTQVHSMTLYR